MKKVKIEMHDKWTIKLEMRDTWTKVATKGCTVRCPTCAEEVTDQEHTCLVATRNYLRAKNKRENAS